MPTTPQKSPADRRIARPETSAGGRKGVSDTLLKTVAGLLSCQDLPEVPPADPMPLLSAWYADAQASGKYDDFNAMTIATATPEGVPSARIVLCKAIEATPPALVFYTSYLSRKGRELEANPNAAALFHWAHAKRQVRVEGTVERVSAVESDAYFKSRPLLSRIGARASCQSTPIGSRAELVASAARVASAAALSGELPRPEHWGGYRLHIRRIELWSAREGRLHDRICWSREDVAGKVGWSAQRISA
jgi:pyridoxamine 5'-phosphate oxidase